MFTYTENDIESHETLKTSIDSPKHTNNTKTHDQVCNSSNIFKNIYSSQKKKVQTNQSCMLICIVLFIFNVEGHPA